MASAMILDPRIYITLLAILALAYMATIGLINSRWFQPVWAGVMLAFGIVTLLFFLDWLWA